MNGAGSRQARGGGLAHPGQSGPPRPNDWQHPRSPFSTARSSLRRHGMPPSPVRPERASSAHVQPWAYRRSSLQPLPKPEWCRNFPAGANRDGSTIGRPRAKPQHRAPWRPYGWHPHSPDPPQARHEATRQPDCSPSLTRPVPRGRCGSSRPIVRNDSSGVASLPRHQSSKRRTQAPLQMDGGSSSHSKT